VSADVTGRTWIALGLAAAGAVFVARSGQGTLAGALSGMAVAAAAILGLGPGALAPLAAFVLGAGALTRLGRDRKEAIGAAEGNRGRRDPRHVAAKLGVPALLGVTGLLSREASLLGLAYTASLAGALADTAATEIGPLAGGGAVVLRGGKLRRAEHGTAGAMSAAGVAAAAGGAACVAASAWGSGLARDGGAFIAAASGFVAAMAESLLAPTPLGVRLGHFGRNALVSAAAAGAAAAAARGLGLD
jgi:uncharacterized membrane protein